MESDNPVIGRWDEKLRRIRLPGAINDLQMLKSAARCSQSNHSRFFFSSEAPPPRAFLIYLE